MRRLLLLAALFAASCTDPATIDPDSGAVAERDATASDAGSDAAVFADAEVEVDAGIEVDSSVSSDLGVADTGVSPNERPDCDPLQPEVCTFPWPSNLYLEADANRATGYTLRFAPEALPMPANGTARVDPVPYAQLDGYGLGTPIMMYFSELDASALPDENNIARSLEDGANIVLLEDAGKGFVRVPYFAELDAHESDSTKQILFVRPAIVLPAERRFIVAVRGLVDRSGELYAPSPAFESLRAGNAADPQLQPRQKRFDRVFADLASQGIDPASLQLAWDFNTASEDALHRRLLSMRDDALAFVGPDGPPLVITSSVVLSTADDPDMHIRIEGTVRVPSYTKIKFFGLFEHTVLNLDANGLPQRNGTKDVNFWMVVPHSITTTKSHGLIQYGHGLLGSGSQTLGGHNKAIANQHNYIFFGCDLAGFSEQDQLAVGLAVNNMSAFEWIGDTIHQGLIDYLVLGRAVQQHVSEIPALQGANIDTSRFHYSGISQGGIFGGTYMAISTDVTRGHLGVPGMNYNLLLYRSVDFTPFFEMMRRSYPPSADQAVLLGLAQLMWDGTDPVSYYRHISAAPFPNTPRHEVLAAPAKGDYQVAVLSMELVARTLGAWMPILANYDDERTPFDLTPADYPHLGSGIVLYDFGNPWPPAGNSTPMDGLGDPHGLPRRLPAHNRQMDHFFRTGEIIDVCGGDGCRPD
jgi:hypothetical protein